MGHRGVDLGTGRDRGAAEQGFRGLLFLGDHRPHRNASDQFPGPEFAEVTWTDLVTFAPGTMEGTATDLFELLGAIAPRILPNDGGITTVIGDYVFGGNKYTGAAGALLAAKHLITEDPDAWLRFEVDADNRVLDIVTYNLDTVQRDGAFVQQYVLQLIAEVKTLPSGVFSRKQYAKLLGQMRKDLVRHATGGDPGLDKLTWLIDPTGYEALRGKLWYMFRTAYSLEKANLANAGVDVGLLRRAIDDKIAEGLLVRPYDI